MIQGIEDYYEKLATEIENSIDDEWTSAELEAVFFSDSSTYLGEYHGKEDGKLASFEVPLSTVRIFRELRTLVRESGKPVWGGVVFSLINSGKFTMNWNYENCDENGDTIFDEEAEHKKHLARNERMFKR